MLCVLSALHGAHAKAVEDLVGRVTLSQRLRHWMNVLKPGSVCQGRPVEDSGFPKVREWKSVRPVTTRVMGSRAGRPTAPELRLTAAD